MNEFIYGVLVGWFVTIAWHKLGMYLGAFHQDDEG